MKNIEKYKETKDALEAFRAWYKDHKHSVLTMSGWLEKEYEAPPPSTLLEAAEAVADEWYTTFPNVMPDTLCEKIVDLAKSIEREKRKPVRNCDRFATQGEAFAEFMKMCYGMRCEHCRFRSCDSICRCAVAWLYAEAEKEEAK